MSSSQLALRELLESSTFKTLHFIGIQGSGMAPMACFVQEFFKNRVRVQGSDLQDRGYLPASFSGEVWQGHDGEYVSASVAAVVYSSAIAEDHVERQAAARLGIPQYHRSELLGALSSFHGFRIWVTGSNGKTSTTALLTHQLVVAGVDVSAVVGGGMIAENRLGYLVGEGGVWVGEADESDGSHAHLGGDVAVITDVTADHLDYYGSQASLLDSIREFALKAKKYVIVGGDDPQLLAALELESLTAEVITVGFKPGVDYQIKEARSSRGGCSFDLLTQGGSSSLSLPSQSYSMPYMLGEHSCKNGAMAVVAAYVHTKNAVSVQESCASFPGVVRRLEKVYEGDQLTVFDDYAHNPLKVRSACEAVRRAYPEAFMEVVFEVHKQHRLKSHMTEFCQALECADHILLPPLYEPTSPLASVVVTPPPHHLVPLFRQHISVPVRPLEDYSKTASCSEALKRASQGTAAVVLILGAGRSYLARQNLAHHLL